MLLSESQKSAFAESRTRIQNCASELARDETTIFGMNIAKFVQCTEESKERDPSVVMRNMRQFMNGMKNYLVRNGEGELHDVIEEERNKVGCPMRFWLVFRIV